MAPHETPPRLPDIRLRDVIAEDLSFLFEHQREPEANKLAAFPARDRAAFMTHWAKIIADDAVVAKVILLEGSVAGNIVSWMQDGERLVGFWLGRDHWGAGGCDAGSSGLSEIPDRSSSVRVRRGAQYCVGFAFSRNVALCRVWRHATLASGWIALKNTRTFSLTTQGRGRVNFARSQTISALRPTRSLPRRPIDNPVDGEDQQRGNEQQTEIGHRCNSMVYFP